MISFLQDNWLEMTGVLLGLIFLILMIKENIWSWPFGIVGSSITVIIFFQAKLYLEAIINAYYVVAGFYGWYFWSNNKKKGEASPPVVEWNTKLHVLNNLICIVLILIVGNFMANYTDSPRPYVDTAMAVYGVSATILEARKVLSAWIYWTVINAISVWLQYDREIYFYAGLSFVYVFMSIQGFFVWRKSYLAQKEIYPQNNY